MQSHPVSFSSGVQASGAALWSLRSQWQREASVQQGTNLTLKLLPPNFLHISLAQTGYMTKLGSHGAEEYNPFPGRIGKTDILVMSTTFLVHWLLGVPCPPWISSFLTCMILNVEFIHSQGFKSSWKLMSTKSSPTVVTCLLNVKALCPSTHTSKFQWS